ncbi:acyltransferase family protein [Massilimicrobiota sp. SW1139]|uniref:acyltransferase family protein n=1 Tax=Massilimicrobiota sp. SW1139 TaxID=2530043 RepID=UPI001438E7DB|nr:acyltransferase family protein [Massilimicrobiota sp. SW1139]
MDIILVIFGLLCLYNLKIVKCNDNYVSISQTQQINGIFVFLILMSHFVTYIDTASSLHNSYMIFRQFLKQLVVTTFLFFSGYGMYESLKKKKENYINKIPQRFLKLLFQFDMAVFLFLILAIILGKDLSFKHVLLSFLAWEGLGNSYWYIFVVLSLYVCMFLSFKITNHKSPLSIILFTICSVGLIYFFIRVGKTSNWYNTIMCFAAGMWFSYFRDKLDRIVDKNLLIYILMLAVSILIFFVSHYYMFDSLIAYEIMGIFFCLTIVLISKKVVFNNPILSFFGQHVFSIYILQRIPMIIGENIGMSQNFWVYFLFVFISTIFIAYYFDKIVGFLQAKIFH